MSTTTKSKAASAPKATTVRPRAMSLPTKLQSRKGLDQLLSEHHIQLARIAAMHNTNIQRITRQIADTVLAHHTITRNSQTLLSPTVETDQQIYDRYSEHLQLYYQRRGTNPAEKLATLQRFLREKPSAFRLQHRDDVIEGYTMRSYNIRDIPALIDLYQELCQYIDDIALHTFQETQRYHKQQVLLTMLIVEKQQSRSKLTQTMRVHHTHTHY